MSFIRKCKDFLLQENNLIKDNKETIGTSNLRLFTVLMRCGVFVCILMLIVSFFIESYSELRLGYVIFFWLDLMSLIILHYYNGENQIILYYVLYSLFSGYAAYSSAFITPDYTGVIILVFIVEIPVIILDRTVRITLYEILVAAGYLAVVVPNKDACLVADEIINVMLFMVISCVTGTFFRTVRLKSIDLSRRLHRERSTDVLTGLSNRRVLFEHFGQYETRQIACNIYAIAIIDIDYFKQYNDTYGHIAGDKCLNQLGQCFKAFGEKNFVDFYRYGGEEFIAIVTQKPECDLTCFFQKLNKEVEALHIPHPYMPGGYVTVSIGVVKFEASDMAMKFESKIEEADEALYKVKSSGKGGTFEYIDRPYS